MKLSHSISAAGVRDSRIGEFNMAVPFTTGTRAGTGCGMSHLEQEYYHRTPAST